MWTESQAKTIGKTAFPEYRGRKICFRVVESVTLCDLNWSGGTRNVYRVVRLTDGRSVRADGLGNTHPAFNPAEGATIRAAAGFAVVQHSFFCGRDCGLTVYLPAAPSIAAAPSPALVS